MAKVKVTLSLDPRSVEVLGELASQLHLSRSAFLDFWLSQVDQSRQLTLPGLADRGKGGGSGKS